MKIVFGKKVYTPFVILFFLLTVSWIANSNVRNLSPDSGKKLVYIFDIKKEIGPPTWRISKQSIEEAQELNADYILIHLNTYGGLVDAADSIRTKILNCEIPVFVFIDNNAASAGALIAIACDSIYMRSGGSIGATTVVTATGETVPDKYQSYMRATMRATAESHGKDTVIRGNDTIIEWHRDPLIADAMVDPRTYIEGVIDTGVVLTFTTEEAVKYGYCEGVADNVYEVLELAGIDNYEIKEYELTALESIIGFLINPIVHGLLIMIIVGGIYFELQSPGIGFPLAAAIIAAVLYFAPLYLEGLVANWELVVFLLGIVLLIVEVFVIPGFGIAGFSGIVLVIIGLSFSMIGNVQFEFDGLKAFNVVFKAFFIVIVSMFLSLILSIYLSKKLFTSQLFPNLALNTVQEREKGFVGVDSKFADIIGKTGVASTILRPAGKIEVEGEIFDAKCEVGYINKGEKVKVIRYETGQLYVVKEG